MKYIKKFESEKQLEIGDYVICNEESTIKEFLNNTIGQYVEYDGKWSFQYCVVYDEIPKNLENYFNVEVPVGYKFARYFNRHEIIHSEKNKKDLEYLTISKNYNL